MKQEFCLLCNHESLSEFPQFLQLKAVSSDCKPWDSGGLITVCKYCGHVQKRMDHFWQKEVARIYAEYSVYHLGGGKEQVIFSDKPPFASPRSAQILERLKQEIRISERGYLLDVGCGNGELLKSFSRKYPEWALAGYEQDDRHRKKILQVPGVKHFYTGRLDRVDCKFDLITLVHVLEHIPQPIRLLEQLREKLTQNGLLLIHVPHFLQNPFDLMVMDHCSHFMVEQLVQLAQYSGFEIVKVTTDWISRYITLVLRISAYNSPDRFDFTKIEIGIDKILKIVKVNFEWLKKLSNHAREIASTADFGIFGTAIAGTWLAGMLGSMVHFFVDEDSSRTNKKHLGREVLSPVDVPEDSRTYMALPLETAKQVYNRLEKLYPSLQLVLPPVL